MPTEVSTIADLLTRPDFWIGVAAAAVLASILFIARSTPGRRVWGLALAGATLTGVNLAVDRRLALVAGAAVLAIGGWALGLAKDHRHASGPPQAVAWLVIGFGVLIVTFRSGLPEIGWVLLLAPILIVSIGFAIQPWVNSPHRHYLGLLMLITAFGIWTTVPDTESARVLLGASIPLSLVTIGPIGARIGSAGAFAIPAVVIWVGATGGEQRPSSIVAAWACLALLVVVPSVAPGLGRWPAWKVVLGHSALVVIFARLFGLWQSTIAAAVAVAVTAGVIFFLAQRIEPTPSSHVGSSS